MSDMSTMNRRRFTLQIHDDIWAWVQEQAARRRVAASIIVREALLAKKESEQKATASG